MPRKLRAEILLSLLLTFGIAAALALPSPRSSRQSAAEQTSLFIVMEGNYLNPLFSSAKAINILNGAAKQFACFAGYDDFTTRVDISDKGHIASVARYGGDLLSMIGISFALKTTNHSAEDYIFISEGFWESAFGRQSNVLGAVLRVHNNDYRIAGVTRERGGLLAGTDIWIPVRSRGQFGGMSSMRILGILKPGNNWLPAQRALSRFFDSSLRDQAYSEAIGAKLLPLDKGITFGDPMPVIAQDRAGKGYLWTGT